MNNYKDWPKENDTANKPTKFTDIAYTKFYEQPDA